MLKTEIEDLRRAEGNRIAYEAGIQDKKVFHAWDEEDLIKNRVLEHYDEEGYEDAPRFIWYRIKTGT